MPTPSCTPAIPPENPEFVTAKERGLHVIHRSQALHWLIGGRRLVSVAGAHGKTTSTGMIVTALQALGADPSFVNGGVIEQLGTSSASGADQLFVVEADESDGTFLLYDTAVALITNVDPDHLDHFGSDEAFHDAFIRFADAARAAVVISSDDPGASRVRAGLSHENVLDLRPRRRCRRTARRCLDHWGGSATTFLCHGWQSVRMAARPFPVSTMPSTPPVPLPSSSRSGTGSPSLVRAVEGFAGTVRRFELHGVERGVSVFDDYAHHPTTRCARLSRKHAALWGEGRLIAIQQPHTFDARSNVHPRSSPRFSTYADHTVMLDVYGAREDPVPGVTGELVSGAFADQSGVHFVADWQQAADYTGLWPERATSSSRSAAATCT